MKVWSLRDLGAKMSSQVTGLWDLGISLTLPSSKIPHSESRNKSTHFRDWLGKWGDSLATCSRSGPGPAHSNLYSNLSLP